MLKPLGLKTPRIHSEELMGNQQTVSGQRFTCRLGSIRNKAL